MLRALAIARARTGRRRASPSSATACCEPSWKSSPESLGCAGAVDFLGYRRDLTRIAAGSDAALLTSDNEGTPVALIEAAAAGRPAVSTAVGGVSDIVIEGAGLLAPAGDEAALAAAISRLSGERELRREMGARAREHVAGRLRCPRLLDDIDRSLLAPCLPGRRPSRSMTA